MTVAAQAITFGRAARWDYSNPSSFSLFDGRSACRTSQIFLSDERFSALRILFMQQIEKERMRNRNPLARGYDEDQSSSSFLPQREELHHPQEITETLFHKRDPSINSMHIGHEVAMSDEMRTWSLANHLVLVIKPFLSEEEKVHLHNFVLFSSTHRRIDRHRCAVAPYLRSCGTSSQQLSANCVSMIFVTAITKPCLLNQTYDSIFSRHRLTNTHPDMIIVVDIQLSGK